MRQESRNASIVESICKAGATVVQAMASRPNDAQYSPPNSQPISSEMPFTRNNQEAGIRPVFTTGTPGFNNQPAGIRPMFSTGTPGVYGTLRGVAPNYSGQGGAIMRPQQHHKS